MATPTTRLRHALGAMVLALIGLAVAADQNCQYEVRAMENRKCVNCLLLEDETAIGSTMEGRGIWGDIRNSALTPPIDCDFNDNNGTRQDAQLARFDAECYGPDGRTQGHLTLNVPWDDMRDDGSEETGAAGPPTLRGWFTPVGRASDPTFVRQGWEVARTGFVANQGPVFMGGCKDPTTGTGTARRRRRAAVGG